MFLHKTLMYICTIVVNKNACPPYLIFIVVINAKCFRWLLYITQPPLGICSKTNTQIS